MLVPFDHAPPPQAHPAHSPWAKLGEGWNDTRNVLLSAVKAPRASDAKNAAANRARQRQMKKADRNVPTF
jgi:hypothetical protein